MKNCYNLSLPFFPLKEDFEFPVSNTGNRVMHLYGKEFLSEECKEWIHESGLKFHKFFIFEDPGQINRRIIHIDGLNNSGKQFAINWNYGVGDFVMEWFRVEGSGLEDNSIYPYAVFNNDESELIESSNRPGAVLFNTSSPHSVMNLDNNIRYGVTLRFFNKLSWPEAVKFLDRYIM